MKLSQVGETGIIKFVEHLCKSETPVEIGVGDDAAVVVIDSRRVAITTDMLIAGIHFPPRLNPEIIGEKAVAVNLSDLAAMGARPIGILFSVGLPKHLEFTYLKRLLRGIDSAAKRYGCQLIGGDLNKSNSVILGGVAIGVCEGKVLTRSGAKRGDLIGISGFVGAASGGLKIMKSGELRKRFPRLVRTQFKPVARVKEGMVLGKTPGITAAIDISDGLARNLWQLSEKSGVRIVVEDIPVHPELRRLSKVKKINAEELALFGGEDYELVFTFQPKALNSLKRAFARIGSELRVIGRVERGRGVYLETRRGLKKIPDSGYEHFKT